MSTKNLRKYFKAGINEYNHGGFSLNTVPKPQPKITQYDDGGPYLNERGPEIGLLQNQLVSQGYELPVSYEKTGKADQWYGEETDTAFKQRAIDMQAAADSYKTDVSNIYYNNGWVPRKVATTINPPVNSNAVVTNTNECLPGDDCDPNNPDGTNNMVLNADGTHSWKPGMYDTDPPEAKWYQKLGNSNSILDIVDGLSILKANREARNANKQIGDLRVKSDTLQAGTYNPSLVDLGDAKANAKELAAAAIQRSQETGRSTAETRALLTAGASAQEKIAVQESELQKKEDNIAQKMNMESRQMAETINISNNRQDQIANNDTLASMYKNSIAITNQMRDAISTKIKDAKMFDSVDRQMQAIADSIAGNSGLDKRKFNSLIDLMMGRDLMTETQAKELKNNYNLLEN